MKVEVIAEDFENCDSYSDCEYCLIATTLRRQFPESKVFVGSRYFEIAFKKTVRLFGVNLFSYQQGYKAYKMPREAQNKIDGFYRKQIAEPFSFETH